MVLSLGIFYSISLLNLDPVIVELWGPFAIRWYGVAYALGVVLGWVVVRQIIKESRFPSLKVRDIDDFISWAVVGIIVGGRLGYVLFYHWAQYIAHPLKIFYVWEGGMSFHGGLIGLILAAYLFTRRGRLPFLTFMDALSVVAPIGLFFGRIANFINGELYGRVTDVRWGMIFPGAGPYPRHPSQLYEAFGEGLLLFIILLSLARRTSITRRSGCLSGIFLIGYSLIRFVVEYFREPDYHIGYLWHYFTMGQLLSLPLLITGIIVLKMGKSEH